MQVQQLLDDTPLGAVPEGCSESKRTPSCAVAVASVEDKLVMAVSTTGLGLHMELSIIRAKN